MKSILLIAALVVCTSLISLRAHAQKPHLGVYGHVLYASPLDNSSQKLYNGGAGIEAGVLIGRKNTLLNGSIGISRFFADNNNNPYGYETYTPVKVGVRQYIPLTLHFLFLQADAGVGVVNSKYSGNDGSRFAGDFGAGVKFGLFEAALMWDNIREEHPKGWSSWLNVKAGLNIGF